MHTVCVQPMPYAFVPYVYVPCESALLAPEAPCAHRPLVAMHVQVHVQHRLVRHSSVVGRGRGCMLLLRCWLLCSLLTCSCPGADHWTSGSTSRVGNQVCYAMRGMYPPSAQRPAPGASRPAAKLFSHNTHKDKVSLERARTLLHRSLSRARSRTLTASCGSLRAAQAHRQARAAAHSHRERRDRRGGGAAHRRRSSPTRVGGDAARSHA